MYSGEREIVHQWNCGCKLRKVIEGDIEKVQVERTRSCTTEDPEHCRMPFFFKFAYRFSARINLKDLHYHLSR